MAAGETLGRLGRVITIVGYLWVLLFLLSTFFIIPGQIGDILDGVFGASLLIPLVLIIAGRIVARNARRTGNDEVFGGIEGQQPVRPAATTPPPAREQSERVRELERRTPTSSIGEPEPEARAVAELAGNLEEEIRKQAAEMSGQKSSDDMIAEAHRRWNKRD